MSLVPAGLAPTVRGISAQAMLDHLQWLETKEACEQSLVTFVRHAWKIVEPGSEFQDNWHLHLIAEHLEEVYRNPAAQDLLINVPPGCMKSLLVCVMWPAWVWLHDPSKRFMGASYSEELSIRDAMKTREIILSDWYQSFWPHVQLQSGQDQKIKYATTASGWRLSTSTGGRATGEHPDFKLCDDPISAAQAQSDAERTRANDWFDNTLSTRGVSRGARTIVVMQRLHEQDVAGHILADIGGYDHICLPMKYEAGKTAHADDPRKTAGELLWPSLFDYDTVLVLEKRLGEYGAAGQLQQRPAPPGGGILKVENFKKWPADRPLPRFQFIVQCYDTAFTEKTSGDPSACSVWGVFEWKNQQNAMLLDCWAQHLGYPDLREKVLSEWSARYGGDSSDPQNRPRRADLLLIEEKGSGISLVQDLRRAGISVRTYNPNRTDKRGRAHQFAPILELGVVWVPESKKTPNEFISWSLPLLDQLEKFPNAANDDLVDTVTMGFIFLRDSQLLELPYAAAIDDEPEVDYHTRRERLGNPYAA